MENVKKHTDVIIVATTKKTIWYQNQIIIKQFFFRKILLRAIDIRSK